MREKNYLSYSLVIYFFVILSSCTTPPPKGDDSPELRYRTWALTNYLEEYYLPEGVEEFILAELSLMDRFENPEQRAFAQTTVLIFERSDYTQLYLFHETNHPASTLDSYRSEVLDTIECFLRKYNERVFYNRRDVVSEYADFQRRAQKGEAHSHCILSVLDYRLEKDFYRKYADSLWTIPTGKHKGIKQPSFYLNHYRSGERRLANFGAADMKKHPILEQFIAEIRENTEIERHITKLLPPWSSDVEHLEAKGIAYSPVVSKIAIWFTDPVDYGPTAWYLWQLPQFRGLSDKTFRSIHHLPGIEDIEIKHTDFKVDSLYTPPEVLRNMSTFIYTRIKTVILPDSFRLLQNLDTLVISADARVPQQLDIILSLKKLRWLVFWQPYTAAEIRDIISKIESVPMPKLQEVWFSCTDCYLENNPDAAVETQYLASLPQRYVIKDYQAMRRKFGLIE